MGKSSKLDYSQGNGIYPQAEEIRPCMSESYSYELAKCDALYAHLLFHSRTPTELLFARGEAAAGRRAWGWREPPKKLPLLS